MQEGRPTDYKPEYCQRVVSEEFYGKHIYQIAPALNVCVATLYNWANEHPEFLDALTRARENRVKYLMDEADDAGKGRTGTKDTRFADRANMEHIRLAGLGRRLPRLKGVDNEHVALSIVQDALSADEITPDYADSMSKLIMTKLEARKVCQMAEDMKLIKEKLGLE